MNIIHKWIIVFLIIIFPIAAIGFAYPDYDDSNTFDEIFLALNSCEVFLTDRFISFVSKSVNPFTTTFPKLKNFTRPPPE